LTPKQITLKHFKFPIKYKNLPEEVNYTVALVMAKISLWCSSLSEHIKLKKIKGRK